MRVISNKLTTIQQKVLDCAKTQREEFTSADLREVLEGDHSSINQTLMSLAKRKLVRQSGSARSLSGKIIKTWKVVGGGSTKPSPLSLDFSAIKGKEPSYDVLFSVKFANGHDKQDKEILAQMVEALPEIFARAVKDKTGREVTIAQ